MKNGISMMMLVIATAVMLILVTSASVIGISSVNTANFEEYKSVLSRISDDVNYYYVENGSLPVKNEGSGVEVVDALSLGLEFYNQVVDSGDESDELYIIDMEKLEDSTVKFSNENDVFLVANNSHNIYSLNGYIYKSKVYYKI